MLCSASRSASTPWVPGAFSVGAIEGDGELASKLGNITLTGLTPSTVGSITFEQEPPDVWVPKEQSLYVTSELEIEDGLTWDSGYAATDGPGTIITAPGSTTHFDASVRLEDGQFVNEGTATWESGGISSGQSTREPGYVPRGCSRVGTNHGRLHPKDPGHVYRREMERSHVSRPRVTRTGIWVAQHSPAFVHTLGYIVKSVNSQAGKHLHTNWNYTVVEPRYTAANISAF